MTPPYGVPASRCCVVPSGRLTGARSHRSGCAATTRVCRSNVTDDVVCHCRTLAEAEALKAALEQRMAQCSLALHPQKTKVVYCRDDNRRERFSVHQLDFLGFCFQPRFARSRAGSVFVSFLPAISPTAAKAIRQTVRRWRLHCRHTVDLMDLAQEINPVHKGWLQYYGASIVRRCTRCSIRWISIWCGGCAGNTSA
jgi:hypothetical protein